MAQPLLLDAQPVPTFSVRGWPKGWADSPLQVLVAPVSKALAPHLLGGHTMPSVGLDTWTGRWDILCAEYPGSDSEGSNGRSRTPECLIRESWEQTRGWHVLKCP